MSVCLFVVSSVCIDWMCKGQALPDYAMFTGGARVVKHSTLTPSALPVKNVWDSMMSWLCITPCQVYEAFVLFIFLEHKFLVLLRVFQRSCLYLRVNEDSPNNCCESNKRAYIGSVVR